MNVSVINLKEKSSKINQIFSPKIVAQLNDYHIKLAKTKGEFVWHKHKDTDELFMVIKGSLQIDLRDKALKLKEGELVVIPKGVEHRPVCNEECTALLIEPAGTINTGDAGGALTDTALEWI